MRDVSEGDAAKATNSPGALNHPCARSVASRGRAAKARRSAALILMELDNVNSRRCRKAGYARTKDQSSGSRLEPASSSDTSLHAKGSEHSRRKTRERRSEPSSRRDKCARRRDNERNTSEESRWWRLTARSEGVHAAAQSAADRRSREQRATRTSDLTSSNGRAHDDSTSVGRRHSDAAEGEEEAICARIAHATAFVIVLRRPQAPWRFFPGVLLGLRPQLHLLGHRLCVLRSALLSLLLCPAIRSHRRRLLVRTLLLLKSTRR